MPTNILKDSDEVFEHDVAPYLRARLQGLSTPVENDINRVKAFLRSQQLKLIQAVKDIIPEEVVRDVPNTGSTYNEGKQVGHNACRSQFLKQLNEMRENL